MYPRKILVIDDQTPKFDQVKNLLSDLFPLSTFRHLKNFQYAVSQLAQSEFDLVVLDMSFNVNYNPSESVGFENLAGLRILQHMFRRNIKIPVIIFTAHSEFSDPGIHSIKGMDELRRYVEEFFPGLCLGCIYSKERPDQIREQFRAIIENE